MSIGKAIAEGRLRAVAVTAEATGSKWPGRADYMNRGDRSPEALANVAAYQAHRKAKLKGQKPPWHGAYGYSTYGCRCDVCKEANRLAARGQRWLT